jgi:hypothetical protein
LLQGTFIDVLSGLFRAVAMAVEQDESSIVGTFGAAALLDVVVGLQAECDSQGLRMLQRFVEARRVTQLVNVSGCICKCIIPGCVALLFVSRRVRQLFCGGKAGHAAGQCEWV